MSSKRLSLNAEIKFDLDATALESSTSRRIIEQMHIIKHSADYISDLVERLTPEESGDLVEFRWLSCEPSEVDDV